MTEPEHHENPGMADVRDEVDLRDPRRPGTPAGIDPEGVERRARLAAALPGEAFPGDARRLRAVARERGASDDVIGMLHRLPDDGRTYRRVQEVADALGLGHEVREVGGEGVRPGPPDRA